MKRLLIVAALLVGGPALGEDAVPTPTVSTAPAAIPAPADGIYYLAVTQADLTTLAQAINELPKKIADPLLSRLDTQLRDQAKVISGVKGK